MWTFQEHRRHAENCVAKAQSADDQRDKVLWLTLAQSWNQLAEHAERMKREILAGDATRDDTEGDNSIDVEQDEDAHAAH
jgi:hypothetical protein